MLFTVTNIYSIFCHKYLSYLLSQISILFAVTNIDPYFCHKCLSYLLSQTTILISITNSYAICCHKYLCHLLSQISILFGIQNIFPQPFQEAVKHHLRLYPYDCVPVLHVWLPGHPDLCQVDQVPVQQVPHGTKSAHW